MTFSGYFKAARCPGADNGGFAQARRARQQPGTSSARGAKAAGAAPLPGGAGGPAVAERGRAWCQQGSLPAPASAVGELPGAGHVSRAYACCLLTSCPSSSQAPGVEF